MLGGEREEEFGGDAFRTGSSFVCCEAEVEGGSEVVGWMLLGSGGGGCAVSEDDIRN